MAEKGMGGKHCVHGWRQLAGRHDMLPAALSALLLPPFLFSPPTSLPSLSPCAPAVSPLSLPPPFYQQWFFPLKVALFLFLHSFWRLSASPSASLICWRRGSPLCLGHVWLTWAILACAILSPKKHHTKNEEGKRKSLLPGRQGGREEEKGGICRLILLKLTCHPPSPFPCPLPCLSSPHVVYMAAF